MLSPETLIAGKYVIKRSLQSGGMGDVYEAWQTDLSRFVAVKTLHPELADDRESFLRFKREAEAAAALGHPNIVQILEFRQDPGEPAVLVMEKLAGTSVRDLLAVERVLEPSRAAFIVMQILSALSAAHAAKIVHRDIKPGNVFLTDTLAMRDFVKVLDFGIAKVLDPTSQPLTDLGQVLGTVRYMAPEQALGQRVDGRADLFSVGVMLFEMITGEHARDLDGAGVFMAARTPCKKLSELAPHLDRGLADLVDRALSLDPAHRPPTAGAMAEALGPFAQRGSSFPGPRASESDATTRDPAPLTQTKKQAVGTMPLALPMASHPPPVPSSHPSYPSSPSFPPPRKTNVAPFIVIPLVIVAVGLAGLGALALLTYFGMTLDRKAQRFVSETKSVPCDHACNYNGKFPVCEGVDPKAIPLETLIIYRSNPKADMQIARIVYRGDGPSWSIKTAWYDDRSARPDQILGTYCK